MLLDPEWVSLSAEENDNNRYLPIKNCLIMEFSLQSFFNEFFYLPQLRHLLNLKWNIGHKLHGTSLILYQSLSVRGMCKYVKNKRVFWIKVEPMGKSVKHFRAMFLIGYCLDNKLWYFILLWGHNDLRPNSKNWHFFNFLLRTKYW